MFSFQGCSTLKPEEPKSLKRHRGKTARNALSALIEYLAKHVPRTNYPELKARGIDIGTGPEESACKNAIGKRLKRGGMRWRLTNAEAMARLRAYVGDISQWKAKWKALKVKQRSYASAA